MALFDNILEIKTHNSAIGAGIELINIQSFIDDAIHYFIEPFIGVTQTSILISEKANHLPDSTHHRVFNLIQKAATGYLIANYADNGAVIIGNSGISVSKTEKSLPASDKKIMQLKRNNLRAAYLAIELAVNTLEENIDDFPTYKVSNEHQENRSLLINTSSDFQRCGINIRNDAQLFHSLKTYINNATENIIAPLFTEAMLATLRNEILSNSLSTIHKKLLQKISSPLAAMAMVEAIPYRVVTIDESGVFELSETVGGISGNVENRRPATDRNLSAVMNALSMRAEQELATLRKFITTNAISLGLTADTTVEINDGTSPNIYFH